MIGTRLAGNLSFVMCGKLSFFGGESFPRSLMNKSSSGPPGCINSALQGVFNEKKESILEEHGYYKHFFVACF